MQVFIFATYHASDAKYVGYSRAADESYGILSHSDRRKLPFDDVLHRIGLTNFLLTTFYPAYVISVVTDVC
jgi:hypothetical protein